MFFTITFRPFTPQPGGLEFLPGNDYYFICELSLYFILNKKNLILFYSILLATSSKDDLHRRIGGRCSTNNMKVVFKVCCAADDRSNNGFSTSGTSSTNLSSAMSSSGSVASQPSQGVYVNTNIGGTVAPNENGIPQIPNINTNISNVVQSTMSWPGWSHNPPHSTPITSTLSVQSFYPYMTSPRPIINNTSVDNNNFNSNYNSPSHKPTKKTSKF